MSGALDFWFDYSCPYAYLASTQVESLAARAGATLCYRPMLLGGILRAVGTAQLPSQTFSPAKARHNLLDIERWARHFNVELQMPASHPLRTVEALRATIVAGNDPRVIHGFFRAYWVLGNAPSERATLEHVLTHAGHDAISLISQLDGAKGELRRCTEEAVTLGIFGAPTFVVDGQLYWGQDRMHFVEHALRMRESSNGA